MRSLGAADSPTRSSCAARSRGTSVFPHERTGTVSKQRDLEVRDGVPLEPVTKPQSATPWVVAFGSITKALGGEQIWSVSAASSTSAVEAGPSITSGAASCCRVGHFMLQTRPRGRRLVQFDRDGILRSTWRRAEWGGRGGSQESKPVPPA